MDFEMIGALVAFAALIMVWAFAPTTPATVAVKPQLVTAKGRATA